MARQCAFQPEYSRGSTCQWQDRTADQAALQATDKSGSEYTDISVNATHINVLRTEKRRSANASDGLKCNCLQLRQFFPQYSTNNRITLL